MDPPQAEVGGLEAPEARPFEDIGRILGDFGPRDRGPTLVVVSGIHGNEPAGVVASTRVCEVLREEAVALGGRVVFAVGNVGALRAGVRYVDRDLNRAWTPDRVDQLRGTQPLDKAPRGAGPAGDAEDGEQQELLAILDRIQAEAPGPLYLVDFHTTSGPGSAFTTVADTLPNRDLALALPVPMVLGLEELVEGTLHDYVGRLGIVTVAMESGQHEDPAAVDRAEAGIWLMLRATHVLTRDTRPDLVRRAHAFLESSHRHLPRALEMRYRHAVEPGDTFRMEDGYRNFQPVRRGEALGRDEDGAVVSPESARILMPLYQAQGTDGFFVVREFRPAWLRLSRILRELNGHRILHWLPGVARHPSDPDALVVNRRVARWYALQILHLLGYRRQIERGNVLVVQRRVHES